MSQNVYELDAADLDDDDGTIVPVDEPGGDGPFAITSAYDKHEWAIKVVNYSDEDIDATPLITTSDDTDFEEYHSLDSLEETVESGGDVPGSVELIDSDSVGAYIAVELTPGAAATGDVKVVFQKRRMA